MRIVAVLFFVLSYFSSCTSQSLKIGVISDIHFLSDSLMNSGEAIDRHLYEAGRNLKETPEILDQVISDYLQSDIDVLLIAGDMTRNGEKQSHIDFVSKLQPLIDKGVRVFVVPGNHDINMPNSVGYSGDSVFSVENVTPQEFERIYESCGYASAIKRDTASLSYVAQLDSKTWLLAIDGCRYKEYKNTSISSGRISDNTELWIKEVLTEAEKNGAKVVAMMHHGLVEHLAFQDMFFSQYLIDDWRRLAALFADGGVRAVFTGHFHANDITEFVSEKGSKIYDVETGSLSSYPYSYRFVELFSDKMDVSTKNVQSISQNSNLFDEGKSRLKQWAEEFALQKLKQRDLPIPKDLQPSIADVASDIILLHVKGDEVVDEELKRKITSIADELELPMMMSPENIEFDFSPSDNNVTIAF